MERKTRTRILVEGDPTLREGLAKEIDDRYPVVTVQDPTDGLVMVRMRESARKSLFYIGEVFATEAKVQVRGTIGLGIIAGDQPEAARQLAVIDAAFNASLPETLVWTERLLGEDERLTARRARDEHAVAATRVNFSSMDDG